MSDQSDDQLGAEQFDEDLVGREDAITSDEADGDSPDEADSSGAKSTVP